MSDYFNEPDDDNDGDEWKEKKKKPKGKIKVNPAGPYQVELLFRGVNWNIVIENVSYDLFKVKAYSDKKISKDEISLLKKYLELEGFEDAAKKHNLYW